eukprot:5751029-Karenia_brevis.AAC.1
MAGLLVACRIRFVTGWVHSDSNRADLLSRVLFWRPKQVLNHIGKHAPREARANISLTSLRRRTEH